MQLFLNGLRLAKPALIATRSDASLARASVVEGMPGGVDVGSSACDAFVGGAMCAKRWSGRPLRRGTVGAILRLASGVSAAALAFAATAPAQAAVYTIDWHGIISDGEDTTGLFGPFGSLIGQAVSLKFKVDTATPGAIHEVDTLGSYISGRGVASPVKASVTIKGVTHEIITHDVYVPTSPYNFIERNDSELTRGAVDELDPTTNADGLFDYVDQTDHVHVFDDVGNQIVNIFGNRAHAEGTSYLTDFADMNVDTAPLNHIFTEDDLNVFASFSIFQEYDEISNHGTSSYSYYDVAFGNFTPTSVSVTMDDAGGGVPEPATWAMIILGFGLIGAAQRRRRALAA